jgi:hypothetical protein
MYLLSILKQHFKDEFDWLSVVAVLLFTSVFVFLQYQFQLISTPIKTFPTHVRIPLYFLLYAVIFGSACAILYWRKQIPNVFRNPQFWLIAFILVLTVSFDQSYFLLTLVRNFPFESLAVKEAVVSLGTYLVSFISVFVPAGILYAYIKPESFFGLSFNRNTRIRPYWALLFVALLLVAIATTSAGVSSYYPVVKRSGLYHNGAELGLPDWLSVTLFEITYASNFITVELLFRGLFVFCLGKFMGKQAILPMAACYMVFHFGKPLIETISSFFGGYLLGVFAFYTRNTWGGIILHIGTALFMELMATLL